MSVEEHTYEDNRYEDNRHENNGHEPYLERVKFDLIKRKVTVARKEYIGDSLVRLYLQGPELIGFRSESPDDHIKIFLPDASGDLSVKRDYTPRRYDAERNELLLEFVAHPGGPAAEWAMAADIGDTLEFGGPRGSQKIHNPEGRWLLIGDESAIPAIARRIEESAAGEAVTAVLLVQSSADAEAIYSWAESVSGAALSVDLSIHCIQRPLSQAGDASGILSYLKESNVDAGTFAWIAGESSMVKSVRRYLMDDLNWSKNYIKASGYWKQGTSEGKENF